MATLRTLYEVAVRGGTESEAQLRNVGKVGAEAFKKIDDAAKQVPNSLRAVDAAAGHVKGNLEGLAAQLGTVGTAANALGGIGTIAAAGVAGVAGLGTALAAMAKNAADSAGKLVDLSDLTGVSTKTLQAYAIAAQGAGVSQDAFGSAIQTFTKNVGDAEIGTGRLTGKLKLLDPAFLGIINNAATVEEKFDLAIKKINELPAGAERASLAIAFFGEQGAKIANVGATVGDVTEKYDALSALIGDKLLRAVDTAGDALDEQTAILNAQVQALETQMAPAILEFETAWVRGTTSAIAGLREMLEVLGLIDHASSAAEFAALSTQRRGLSAQLKTAEDTQGTLAGAVFGTAEVDNLKEQIRLIDERMVLLHQTQKDEKAASDQEAKDLQRNHQLKQGELAEVRAQQALQKKLDADAKKNASEAASAQKKATAEHAAGLAAVVELEQKAETAGLEGVEKLEAERDVAYQKFAELVEKDGLNQEEAARGYLAIWTAADRAITQERQNEADKRAEADQREADKQAKIAERQAEKLAQEINRPVEEALADIGRVGQNALEAFASGAHVTFADIANDLKSTIIHALIELAKQQILLSIGAQVTGDAGGAGGAAGGGGGGFTGILQQGQQLLSLGKTLKGGFDLLTGALGTSTTAITGLTGSVETVGSVFGSSVFAGTGALSPEVLSTAAIGAGPVTGALGSGVVAPGFVIDAATGTVIATGVGPATGSTLSAGLGAAGTATAGIGAALASTGILAAAAAAVIGIMGTLETSQALLKARDTFATRDQGKDLAQNLIHDQPILNIIAELSTRLTTLGIMGGKQGGNAMFDLFQGQVSAGNIVKTIGLIMANPLAPLIFLAANPSTGGTALRKRFEEWVENGPKGEDGFGFFGRDSGTFKRGVGQTGLSATDVHGKDIQAKFRESIGEGARGIQRDQGIDFVDAQKVFIERQREAIGLTKEELKQVTGLGAAFRALQGKEVGEEDARTFGVIADFLGSIAVEGASAAETMGIVADATASLGRPAAVFEKLNEFFLSRDNDIQVQTYRDAIQGLAAALFQDLPQGVDAAALALDELNKAGDGAVQFDDINKRIEAAVVEAQALGPAVHDAFIAGFSDSGINTETFGTQLFDAIGEGLKQTIAENVFDGLMDGVFKGDVLGPFLATLKDTIAKVKSGDLTQGEANAILADAARDARASLEGFRPLIEEAVAAGKDLAAVFEDIDANARAASKAILSDALAKLAQGVAGSPRDFLVTDLASGQAIDSFHDAVLAAVRDATIQGFVQAMLDDAIDTAVLAPFTAIATKAFADITSGEISPEEGIRRINAAFADADSVLHTLDPALQAFIRNVAHLSESMGGGSEFSPREVAGASLDRQLLGALDPQLAKQFDLEVTQRQRLHDAKALGLDLTKVERLNALEREAIAQDSADNLAKIEQDRADQIARVMDQFFADVARNLEAIRDLVTSLTASPASPLPPEVAFANAQANLQQLFAAAQGGDADALAKIPEAFQNAEALAQQLFGSTDRFFQFFGPALAQLEASGALDAKSFQVSPDVQAQIDAINDAADKQITTENKHHAEAMALFQAMLDALTLTPGGDVITQTGGGSGTGDLKPIGIVGGTAGQFGLSESESRSLQTVLGSARVGGDIQTDIQDMLTRDQFDGKYGPLLAQLFEGATSQHGKHAVLAALNEKISHPGVFSPVLGFASGGSFLVPGRPGSGDIFPMLPNVRASPGETVTVTTHGMDQALRDLRDINARIGVDTVATLRALQAQNAELLGRVASLERAILGEVQRPRVVPLQTRVL